jgi:hypothetical protein
MRRAIVLAGFLLVVLTPASPCQVVVYSNHTGTPAGAFPNGGAATQGTNTITLLVADDISPISAAVGQSVTQFTFSAANQNPTPVTVRPRVQFFDTTGAGGAPGNLLLTLSFPQTTLVTGVSLLQSAPLTPGQFVLPSIFWAGVVFDDNNGATGITAAQLDNVGQAVFNPPTVGSSFDVAWQSTNPGIQGNNQAGSGFNLRGTPPVNFGWEFQVASVPEPGSFALVGLAVAGFAWHRRRRGR